MKGDDRINAGFETRFALPPVVIQCRGRPLTRFGLDTTPLERESIAVEADLRAHRDVVTPAVPGVACVAGWLRTRRSDTVLPLPPVVVPVPAFDLVRRCRSPPPKAGWKRSCLVGHYDA